MNYTLFVTSSCKNTKNSENIQRRNCKSVARTSPTTATTTAPPTATLTPTPTAPASPGICELRPVPPARTPKTPAPAHRNSDSALSHEKRASATRNPLLHRTAPKPSLSISKSPIRGTRAEYLRRPPSRPHRPHWDPWRASAGSSNGRSGYPYPATRARRPERPKRPHCRSAG